MKTILITLLLLAATPLRSDNLPLATKWSGGNLWISSAGVNQYPIWIEEPFSYRLEGILTNFVTNVVSVMDRDPGIKCPVCNGPAHHLCRETVCEVTPRYTLRICTSGKDGTSRTNDALLAKGGSFTITTTNLVDRTVPPLVLTNIAMTPTNYIILSR
jgi:hypothetical protein